MAIPIGRPLKLLCRCASGTHQCKVTNRDYNFKSTVCTYLHRHIDIQAGVHTMAMQQWSVELKYTMCTCIHWHIDMQAGAHSMPMCRWQSTSVHPYNCSADVPVLPTSSTPPMRNITLNLPCVHPCTIIHIYIYINNFMLMGTLKYI